jgi:hypothetical protein
MSDPNKTNLYDQRLVDGLHSKNYFLVVSDLVNKLNNEEIIHLLGVIFMNRPTSVFIGMYPKGTLRSAELDKENPVHLNGTSIQINTEYAFTDEPISWEKE